MSDVFLSARNATFDALIARLDARLSAFSPALDDTASNARRECLGLLRAGVLHLKSGALNEALSKASLRSCALAAALGLRTPKFEPVYFNVDDADGARAALFLCEKLLEGARADFDRSRALLQQKILSEKPPEPLKLQMAASCEALSVAYAEACETLAELL